MSNLISEENIIVITKFLVRCKIVDVYSSIIVIENTIEINPAADSLHIEKVVVICKDSLGNIDIETINPRVCYIYVVSNYEVLVNLLINNDIDLIDQLSRNVLFLHLTGIITSIRNNNMIECYYLHKNTTLDEDQVKAIEAIRNESASEIGLLVDNSLGSTNYDLVAYRHEEQIDVSTLHVINSNDFYNLLGVTYIFVIYRDIKINNRSLFHTLYVVKINNIVSLLYL